MNKLQTARANRINKKMQLRFPDYTFSYGDMVTVSCEGRKTVLFQAVSPEGVKTTRNLNIENTDDGDNISFYDQGIFMSNIYAARDAEKLTNWRDSFQSPTQ